MNLASRKQTDLPYTWLLLIISSQSRRSLAHVMLSCTDSAHTRVQLLRIPSSTPCDVDLFFHMSCLTTLNSTVL